MSNIRADITAAWKAILEQPRGPSKTIHNPKCETMRAGDLAKCNCGGWAFRC